MDSEISLIECFELQLSEAEMLRSMYPNNQEFSISCPFVLTDMNQFVSGESKSLPDQLDFTLNLKIPDRKETLEVYVCLPHKYPFSKPEICARSSGLSRFQQAQLNSAVAEFIQSSHHAGDLCILSVINWFLENATDFFYLDTHKEEDVDAKQQDTAATYTLCRMWIYSHHIYNKTKRRAILSSGEDLNLTGFSLPGKPGFICVEGHKRDCSEFWQNLKPMGWKKLSLVREETEVSGDVEDFRKFDGFSEISFEVRRGPAREYHMDMGQFLKYLTDHNCAYAFQDLFGLEGQISSEK